MTDAISEVGLYVPGSVTLEGDFTFIGTDFGVGVEDTLTISGGSLKGVATGPFNDPDNDTSIGIYTRGSKEGQALSHLIINEGVTRVEGQGNEAALQTDDLSADHFKATSPTGAFYIGEDVRSFVLEDLSDKAKTLVLEPYYGAEYNVWVGARRVNSENKNDILGDGKAQYDPSTKTLTLSDPVIPNYYKRFGFSTNYQIYTEEDLILKGSYHMADAEELPAKGIASEKSPAA